jgi:hypothetical protein
MNKKQQQLKKLSDNEILWNQSLPLDIELIPKDVLLLENGRRRF